MLYRSVGYNFESCKSYFLRNRRFHNGNIWKSKILGESEDVESSVNSNGSLDHTKTSKKAVSYSDANFDETEYYIENGLRKVYPYYHNYETFCKNRWSGKRLLHVYETEFGSSADNHLNRILNGQLIVNGEQVNPDYVLKSGDHLFSNVHRHESPILSTPLKVVQDEEVIIVEKPSSIPVHPTGHYRHNSVIFLLAKEHNLKGMYIIHRLDKLTSGLVIFTRTIKKAKELIKQIADREVEKTYVCRVEGNFPDKKITCDSPIKKLRDKIGVSVVDKKGKDSYTEFQKISFNGKSSVVLCTPKTGRTHQIRVHLQFLGYPIINDPLYNSHVFGPNKGKNGEFGKSIKDLKLDLCKEHDSVKWFCDESVDIADEIVLDPRSTKDPDKMSFDETCTSCIHKIRDPTISELVMYLHALKYKGKDWSYENDLPKWADSSWIEN